MKIFLITLFFIGIIVTVIGFYQSKSTCPKNKVVYKFIDQSLEESQKGDQLSVLHLYKPMFQNNSVLT